MSVVDLVVGSVSVSVIFSYSGNELRFRDSLREINELRLEKSRTLDAFYSHRDHRYTLEVSTV